LDPYGLNERAEALRSRLARTDDAAILAGLPTEAKALARAWEDASLDDRRQIVAATIDRVVIHPGVKGRNYFDPERVEIKWRA
jgi:site-specific DNA recombinase